MDLTVTFCPAPENHGYKIQRVDLEGQPVIDAVAENVIETTRGTVLGVGNARCSTIEHGLSALYAFGIDNVLIMVNGPEFPILDGSASPYVQKIHEAGISEQNAEKDWLIVSEPIEIKDENTGSHISILPADDFAVSVTIAFNSKMMRDAIFLPIPGTRCTAVTSCAEMSSASFAGSYSDSAAKATFGPTPLTVMRRSNRAFSSSEENP
jgi:UDP-3-O-[3-hydroxymyristoyl] N-acetylglucosamine deacetylase/3-hydroxyacyl-[acyl-carrier-protein] dehydratase